MDDRMPVNEIAVPEFVPQGRVSGGLSLKALWYTWRRFPLGLLSLGLIILLVTVAVAGPYVRPHDPGRFIGMPLESPTGRSPLGTNGLGQDVLSRTIAGAQVSIAVGLTSTLLALGTFTLLGVVSGYVGGWLDLVIQRVAEVLASVPSLVLALVLIAALGRPPEVGGSLLEIAWQMRSIEMAIAVGFIFAGMRIIRAATLKERNLPYVEAAQTIGASHLRIIFRHILPNVMPYVFIGIGALFGGSILIEAALSFLGYGVAIGTPSWGADLSGSNRTYFLQAPWLMVGPGVALSLTILAFNFFSDALRDMLDPRLRGSR